MERPKYGKKKETSYALKRDEHKLPVVEVPVPDDDGDEEEDPFAEDPVPSKPVVTAAAVIANTTMFDDVEEGGEVVSGKRLAELTQLAGTARFQRILVRHNASIKNMFRNPDWDKWRMDEFIEAYSIISKIITTSKGAVPDVMGKWSEEDFAKTDDYTLSELVASIKPKANAGKVVLTCSTIVKELVRVRGVRIECDKVGPDTRFNLLIEGHDDVRLPVVTDRDSVRFGMPKQGSEKRFLNLLREVTRLQIDYYDLTEAELVNRNFFLSTNGFVRRAGRWTVDRRAIPDIEGLAKHTEAIIRRIEAVADQYTVWANTGVSMEDISGKKQPLKFVDALVGRHRDCDPGPKYLKALEATGPKYFGKDSPAREWVDRLVKVGSHSALTLVKMWRDKKSDAMVSPRWGYANAVELLESSRARFRNIAPGAEKLTKKLTAPENASMFGTIVATPMKMQKILNELYNYQGFERVWEKVGAVDYYGVSTDKMGNVIDEYAMKKEVTRYDLDPTLSGRFQNGVHPADLGSVVADDGQGKMCVDDTFKLRDAVKGAVGMQFDHSWKHAVFARAGYEVVVAKFMALPTDRIAKPSQSELSMLGWYDGFKFFPGGSYHTNEYYIAMWGRRPSVRELSKAEIQEIASFRIVHSYVMIAANHYMNHAIWWGWHSPPQQILYRAMDELSDFGSWDGECYDKFPNPTRILGKVDEKSKLRGHKAAGSDEDAEDDSLFEDENA